ncbi:type VI secretion system-associated protein TagO, partial [Sulfitobacter sp. 1A09149]|uniref:type VI secretion system-associated protein TagO n=1 Tax=Sulfitobacter sp. 1A09149 TaxID=3368584 RepID=UPI003744BE3D
MFPARNDTLIALLLAVSAQAGHAQTDEPKSCHTLSDLERRLSCYDEATGYAPQEPTEEEAPEVVASVATPPQGGQWIYSNEESALDGRKDVWLSVLSENTQGNQINRPEKARLWVRCMQDSTNIFITFNNYTTDNQTVRYRLDEDGMKTIWMETMNGGEGIGIWSGGRAIPMIKSIFGKEKLVLGYSSYSSNNLEFTFDVSGLRARIDPLAESCHWQP